MAENKQTAGSCCEPNCCAAPELIEPDLELIGQLQEAGCGDLKKCMQCSTCSVACQISPDSNPFPRKEMLWASWGLRDRLVKNPDIWLCHQCNDCSTLCPRCAKPGDTLAIARNLAFQRYALPGFMGKALSDRKYLAPLLLAPIVIVGLIVALSATGIATKIGQAVHFPLHDTFYAGSIEKPGPFSLVLMDPIFGGLMGLSILLLLVSLKNFWSDITAARPIREGLQPLSFVVGLIEAVKEIATHSRFGECSASKPRQLGHLLTMYGCIGLFITTAIVFAGLYFGGLIGLPLHLPMPLLHPVKILGNVSAIAFIAGCYLLAYRRATDTENAGLTNYYDWVFLAVLGAVGASGILSEVARLALGGTAPVVAYTFYFIHLVTVFFLLVYLPYSKFAHLCYRTLAIVHAKMTRRYDAIPQAVTARAAAAESEGDAA